MAATLAGGAGAALSRRSAAALWGIRPSSRTQPDVTAPRRRRSNDAVDFHEGALLADEVTVARGIPVTTVPRTLLDLAAVLDERRLEAALNAAEALPLADALSLDDLIARYPRRPGVAKLKTVLSHARIGVTVTRSELKERFLSFLRDADLPTPHVNRWLEVAGRRMEVDCAWPERALIVELDGHATHGTRAGFERDRTRDRTLQAAGWRVVRITWRQLHEAPAAIASDLNALLR